MGKRIAVLSAVLLLFLQTPVFGQAERAQDDYYEFVNGKKIEEITLEPTEAGWDWFSDAETVVRGEMEETIRELVNGGETYEKGSPEQKIKDLYQCISDMDNRNETGLGPLQPYMDKIRGASDIEEYVEALAYLSGEMGYSSILGGYSIMQDKADSGKYAVYLLYADTLIGKEYVEDEDTQEYVELYFDYVRNMLTEFGMTGEQAERSAASIEGLLRDICESSMSAEQYYDPSLTYNVYTEQELQELYTNVDVHGMLETIRIDGQEYYVVMDVDQAQKINSLLVEENLQALKDYSTFVMLNDMAEYMNSIYAGLYTDMQNMLYGITESWEDEFIWMDLTQKMLPWDCGKIYVQKHFSEEDKETVEEMLDLILEEYEKIIQRQDWMSPSTKEKAIRKLKTMQIKIGYPDKWPAVCDTMQVTPVSEGGSLLSNLVKNLQVSLENDLAKLGTEVDRTEWDVTPQTVNAFYDPLNNEISFPAAMLQEPFYSSEYSDGTNLGGIGFVLAHEVSHAFDSDGALYDEYGNYHVWWTEEDLDAYEKMTQSIAEYYDKYEVMGTHVDGERTLAENIADLGAMTCITSIIGDDKEMLEDAFWQTAYIWAEVCTESFTQYLLNTDTHSPHKVRVNAVMSSCDVFYDVYNVKEGDGMYVAPEDRVGIWK